MEGDDQLWGVDVAPLLGAIARCHCSVLWWGQGVVPLQGAIVVCYVLGGVDVVPLQGAIVVCYGLGGGRRPTLGEWTVDVAGCH